MKFLLALALLVASAAAQGDVVNGFAQVTFDFTGFGPDVSVSACDRNTYSNQGGQPRTYTVATTNFVEECTFSIVEGGAARQLVQVQISNNAVVNVPAQRYRATLVVHLEKYLPPSPNSFCVRLRTQEGATAHPQVFRNYCDIPSDGSNRIPLNALTGGNAGGDAAFRVVVLRTSQQVTVWAEENTATEEGVVFVDGHNGLGLRVDSDCSDGNCDSGRLVAELEVPLGCDEATVNDWPNVDLALSWNSSPDEAPVAPDFRRYANVPAGHQYYWVLAADNYRVRADYPSSAGFTAGGEAQSKTVAAACFPGTCEALPLTSVLTVSIPELTADVQISIAGKDQWSAFTGITGQAKFCVFNLVDTEVRATFANNVQVFRDNINCETVQQTCNAGVFASRLCPDFGCLAEHPNGPQSVRYVIFDQFQGIVHDVSGNPREILTCAWVPAIEHLAVEVIEGGATCPTTYSCAQCRKDSQGNCATQAAGCSQNNQCESCVASNLDIFNAQCNDDENAARNALFSCLDGQCATCANVEAQYTQGCVRHVLATTSCANTVGSTEATQCATVEGSTFGRVLSAFDLFFLPTRVEVRLTTSDAQTFRTIPNQGGEPRCYCVLPSVVRVELRETNFATWGSGDEHCVDKVEGASQDCSVCDFLTILDFDLTGIPRAAMATLSTSELSATSINDATPFRVVNWVGGIVNHVAALRSGAGTLPPMRTWVTVNDNGAERALSNRCSEKTCEFSPFVCTLCLDLADPEGVDAGKGVCEASGAGRLTVSLKTEMGAVFRTIPEQGCCNGCAVDTTKKSLLAAKTEYRPQCGRYAVLCNAVRYNLRERTAETVDEPVDCDVNGGVCEQQDLIRKLTVDTRCGTGSTGFPAVATQFIDVTLGDAQGQQIRGPRSAFTQNCSIGEEYWTGPTCPNVGNMEVALGVIKAGYQVRVEQLRVDSRRTNYPDRSEHPTVDVAVACGVNDSCVAPSGSIFSLLLVRSNRGLPDSNPGPAMAQVKFGQVQQNVMAAYSALAQPPILQAPQVNQFCVLADDRVAYAVQWEAYSSDGPNRPFTDCSDRGTPTQLDICRTSGQGIVIIPQDDEKK